MNVGATAIEQYGYYYAWGETETKDRYYKSTFNPMFADDLDKNGVTYRYSLTANYDAATKDGARNGECLMSLR